MAFDPRLTPARPDIAAKYLQGKVEAARFVEGETREVRDATAPLRRDPSPDAALDTEVLKGEHVVVYETNDEGWCWGQLKKDGYVGWLPANALAVPGKPATHKVSALRTLVFPGPDIKLTPVESLPLGASLAIIREQSPFAVSPSGFVPATHLLPIAKAEHDFVAVAERFLNAPYLWGGKTNDGIDCSGLVQIALHACNIHCPRDSDMQQQALGEALDPKAALSNLRRGDLMFWKGHVAIARDAETLIHANAFHMAVAIEPAEAALRRIATNAGDIVAIKRLPAIGADS